MKKIILSCLLCFGVVFLITGCDKTTISDEYTDDDMKSLIQNVYQNVDIDMPEVQSSTVDVSDPAAIKIYSGIESADKVEYLVESEPIDSSVPFSFVLVKVSKDANVKKIEKEVIENLDMNRWIEDKTTKLYVNSYGRVIVIVMSNNTYADPVYNAFKNYAGDEVGKEYTKTNE